jgi:hypothetical protein
MRQVIVDNLTPLDQHTGLGTLKIERKSNGQFIFQFPETTERRLKII